MSLMAQAYKLERGSSVFSLDRQQLPPSQDALLGAGHDSLPLRRPSQHHSLPATSFNHKSTLLDPATDSYGCGRRRSAKSSRNISAPKPRPLAAASIVNEPSRRVHSMRILGTPKTLSAEGLPLDWRDDTYLLHKQGIGSGSAHVGLWPTVINAKPSMDSSISLPRGFSQELSSTTGFSQEFPSKKGSSHEFLSKNKAPARQQSPSSNKNKAGFRYLNAKMVAGKLVKALTKDKASQGEATDNKLESSQAHKGKRNVTTDAKRKAPKPNASMELPIDGLLSDVDSGNGYTGSPPQASIEYECRELRTQDGQVSSPELWLATLHSETLNPASEKDSFYDVLDPLEARARAFEEQAAMFGSGNELSDVLIRTLVNDGDREYDTLEIHIDGLRKELRKHMEEKRDLALKMAAELRARLFEKGRAEEMLKKARAEMESKVRMMEREKMEIKNRLQEDMEECETQWVSKYEKIRSKEKRLSERLKEILDEKVELHKEVSALTTKKNALVEEVQEYKESMQNLQEKADESVQEAAKLRRVVEQSVAQSSLRAIEGVAIEGKVAEEGNNTLARKYKHKEKEVGKLQKLCKEQEKTISGLRIALGEQANNAQLGKGEFIIKLQRELVRLTGIEQGLRKEVEAYKAEGLAARRENASLIERLGGIMKKAGSMAVRTADVNEDTGLTHKVIKHANHTHNRGSDNGCVMRLEDDEREAELDSNNNSMALVLLRPPPAAAVLDDVAGHNHGFGHVHDLITSGLESHFREGEELEKLKDEVQNLVQSKTRLQEEASNLHNALSLTNRRVQELEAQLANKEQELGGIHKELERVREQRDNVQKESDFMGREAIQLSAQVERLSRKIERLDEDVMVKEGQLSILRGALHNNSE